MHFLLFCSLSVADAGVATGDMATKESSAISPTLKPKSDKKFFDKDYPWDKRPKVDVFHFKHPYPVVQDSSEFDSDFVKDENSDNGSWKAQTEYDRLRHKLAKEKADVAKALEAKKKAEEELHDAVKKEKDQEEKKKKVEKEKEEEEKKKKVAEKESGSGTEEEKQTVKKAVPAKIPGGVTSPGEVKVAAGETEKAMDALDECKKQLAEAREKLKKLMKELEEAKKRQEETQAALDAALERLEKLEGGKAAVEGRMNKEYQEYLDAKKDYEKQQAKVAQMEADIKAAAAKVKAFRDAEDKNGGVYPTQQSGAVQRSITPLTSLMLLVGPFLLQ